MDNVDRFVERVATSVEAGGKLSKASELCRKAESLAEEGSYMMAGITALEAAAKADAARRFLFQAYDSEVEDMTPEPTEEEKADMQAELALYEGAEGLKGACEAVLPYVGRLPLDVQATLREALEKARP